MPKTPIDPKQKAYTISIARQACARVFRDGGAPSDALDAFGLTAGDRSVGWQDAVDLIANAIVDQHTAQHLAA